MVYKYQKETIDEIKKIVDKLETMTNEHYRVKIGTTIENISEFYNGIENEIVPIFMEVNGEYYFTKQNEKERFFGEIYSKCEIEYLDILHLKKDIFLQMNKLLDTIITDNKEREQFHENLNYELKALNKALEE
ncbi:MAG: hypothetical protein IKF82_00340 [Bacilli bacterium]|nr:hypothetical protein [Bacilli bacterium]